MRWTTVDGQFGYSGVWGSPTAGPTPEKVWGIFRNSNTKTATITAASFARGNPAILTVASASNNGFDIVQPDTMNQDTNHLFVGIVDDYPDTSVGKTGVWNPEDFGIVQIYGINTKAVVSIGTVSIAGPKILLPDTGSQFQTVATPFFGTGTASTVTNQALTGLIGQAYLYGSIASSSGSGTVAATAFLRCM